MSKLSQLKIKLDAVVIGEYENYVVYALYMNNKFSRVLTINIDGLE